MDDFGTGYSSLSYLRNFPFDKIKIDRSFISGPAGRQRFDRDRAAVTGLAASLNMTTTAEGVETAEQFEQVRALGCVEMQGYLFSRPLPLARSCRCWSAAASREARPTSALAKLRRRRRKCRACSTIA